MKRTAPEQAIEIKSDLKSMKTDVYEMKLDMAVIKNDIANIKQNMVNKADLAGFETNLIKWLVGAVVAGIGLAVGIAKLI